MIFRQLLKNSIANSPLLGPLLGDALHLMRHRVAAIAILRDLLETRRKAAFLRDFSPPNNGRRLLVLSLNDDSIYRLKLEAMLAVALKLYGWQPCVVFDSRMRTQGRRYHQAFGIDDFVYLYDVQLSRHEERYCQELASALADSAHDLKEVKSWRFMDSWIGPQIISTLSRLRFEAMPDFSSPEIRQLLSRLLPEVLKHVMRAHKLIERQDADLAIVNEANYSMFGPLVDICVARNIDVIQFIQPWRDDSLLFWRLTRATRRDHPGAVTKQTLDMLMRQSWTPAHEEALNRVFHDRYSGKWFLQARNQVNTRNRTRAQLVSDLGLDRNKKIAVVFSHVLWDGNLFYGDDLFKDNGDWFIETLKAACANDKLTWLIKLHPANVWKRSYEKVTSEYAEVNLIRRKIGMLPAHVKILPADTDVSTYSLFQSIDYGITIRGTVGMELPCFGVPCVTAGTGRYAGLGFTVDPTSVEEYKAVLEKLQTLAPLTPEQILRAKWHAFASFVLRPWIMKSFRAEHAMRKRGRHPLDYNLILHAASLDEITNNDDLGKWSRWVKTDTCDYIDWSLLANSAHGFESLVDVRIA